METTYDRNEVVAEVKSYYEFLTTLFLDEEAVLLPPDGGWPSITKDSVAWLNKTDTVVDLLQHLPYIRRDSDQDPWHMYENTSAVDYRGKYYEYAARIKGDDWIAPDKLQTSLPSHVITFATTPGGRNGNYILLDTERGTVTLCDFQERGRGTALSQSVPEDSPEQWRRYATYTVVDFFAKLKREFQNLDVYPLGGTDIWPSRDHTTPAFRWLEPIFKAHGWGTEGYEKDACMAAISTAFSDWLKRG